MSDRIKLAALLGVALVATGMLGIVVYNYVANDWRLAGNPLDLSFLTGDEASEPESDGRSLVRTLVFGDSVVSVRIETSAVRVRLVGADSGRIEVRFALAGDATDSTRFTASAIASSGRLHIAAAPSGAAGNASGVVELAIPPALPITVIAHDGDISVLNVTSALELTASGGSIDLAGVRGVVRASAAGDIALDGCSLDSAALRAGAAVTLSLTEGPMRIEAAEVRAARHFGALDATARGAISAAILSSTAPLRLVAGGNVQLRVLDGARFAFDIEAPQGTIVANVPFDTLTRANATEHVVRASMNGGGVPAVIRCARGSVEILLFEAGETSDYHPHVEDRTRNSGLVLRAVQHVSGPARRAMEGS